MPDILTHIAFALEVIQGIPNIKINEKEEILKRIRLLNLGAQGPDIFFYYIPLKRGNAVNSAGGILHSEKTGAFLTAMLDAVQSYEKDTEKYWNVVVYVIGFICHYYLDKNAHPFVYAHCGFHFQDGREKRKNPYGHRKMESIIDAVIWKAKKDKEAYYEPVFELIQLENGMPKEVSLLLEKCIEAVYKIQVTVRDVEDSLDGFLRVYRLLYDPVHIKKKLLKTVERFISKEIKLPKLFYPVDLNNSGQYINQDKNKWIHPLDGSRIFDASFEEIYDQSKEQCAKALDIILFDLREKCKTPKETLGNDSYLTNMDCDSEENKQVSIGEGIINR